MSIEKVELANGAAVLYRGDCMDVLPTLPKVDAVITDPPYGINGGSGGDSRDYGKGEYVGAWIDSEEYVKTVCVPAIVAALGLAERGAVTPGIRCLHLYPRAVDIGCFWTPASVTHGPWGFSNFQPILYFGKDFRAGKGALPSGIAVTEAAEKNGHPCPKPIRPWKWLLDKASKPGETIIDPFMGSGTTGVACAQLGRRFIGIEREPKYFEIACKRIEAAYAQGQLFEPEPPKPEQAEIAA